MGINMNNADFISELSKRANISEEDSVRIIEIIEENFLVGNKNKDKITELLITELNFDNQKADEIYDVLGDILAGGIKEKIKNLF